MKAFAALLVGGIAAALLFVAPVGAYLLDLTQWNESALELTGDHVTVTVAGSAGNNTIVFTWVSGDGATPPTANDLDEIFWTAAVATAGGTATSPLYTVGIPKAKATDGFNTTNGYPAYTVQASDGASKTKTATFTFANDLSATSFTANDFVARVTYDLSCGGFVGGPGTGGSGPPFNDPANAGCTPVPEPITMFLGGTGLLILGYIARKRLFRQFAS